MRTPVRRTASLLLLGVLPAFAAACGSSSQPDAMGNAARTNAGTGNGNGGGTGSGVGGNTGLPGDPNGGGTVGLAGTGNVAGAAAMSGPYVASESVVRKLSRAEFDNTLLDLLGDATNPASQFLPEDQFSPYDNDYTLQLASAALVDSLQRLAEDVAARLIADPTRLATIVPCTPATPGDAACFSQVVGGLLPRAYRRPVTQDEIDRYMSLLTYATENNPDVPHDFNTAVGLFVRSLLQDPEFLYRIEVGTPTANGGVDALTSHEIASRMSYLLWGTMPDATLLTTADAGMLADAATRTTEATRLLQDPRARAQLHRFHAMWLGYRAIPVDGTLAAAFSRETSALLDRVMFDEPQNYLNLFTFPETFIDATLAEHYGLPAPAAEGWVSYGMSGRAGLLSHGSVLSAFGKFSDTSPTQRGIFVRTRLMCEKVSPPPPNVNTDQPPTSMTAVCKADRYAEHRANAACATCHGMLDPIGLGLENYDLSGQWRDHDNNNVDCAIDGQGEIKPYGAFSGPAQLAQILIDNNEIDDCVVRQYLSFALGRPLLAAEDTPISDLVTSFRQSD
ncbi:MAG TPA: DUF1588 domain-containing protein, partial [Polyangiaceae bacterium]|nr:DUF1588 domain-containing protein [Polyangiaceae bacterium]